VTISADAEKIRAWQARRKPLTRNSGLHVVGFVPTVIDGGLNAREESGPKKSGPSRRRDTGPSAKVRHLVLERDGFACVCCGWPTLGQVYSLQHRKRRSQGGDNSPPNLVTVLGDGTTGCHQRIDSRIDPEDEARGYTVRSWQNPADVPVMIFSKWGGEVMKYLTEDGRYSDSRPEGNDAA
jgi:hypothetical protein